MLKVTDRLIWELMQK
uniref:Uncharacterized protein n=1 Tax=Anguilla anguilla TaxID=7936 RepID=A0A0E9XMT6_ANGAN